VRLDERGAHEPPADVQLRRALTVDTIGDQRDQTAGDGNVGRTAPAFQPVNSAAPARTPPPAALLS